MTRSRATTVAAYLAALPAARRAELAKVRQAVKTRLPKGYRETMCAGMITWEVPLAVYRDTYNGHALWYAALGAQKGYSSLYLMAAYGNKDLAARLKTGFRKAGKKLNMGKSCIRFTRADDLALDVIGAVVASVPIDRYVAIAKAARTP